MEDDSSSPQHDVVSRRLTTPGVSSAAERRRRLARRSDPGLSVIYDELSALDSGWDVTTAATTSCIVTRSSSLRNSFLRARAREPLWIQSKYVSSVQGFVGSVFAMETVEDPLYDNRKQRVITVLQIAVTQEY